MDHYQETSGKWNKLAKLYEEKFMHLDLYNDSYDYFLKSINANGRILEVGCGPGNISKYLLSKIPTLAITGIDVSLNMIELAKANIPSGNFEVLDGRDVNKLNIKFEGIVLGFCLPYFNLNDGYKLIEDCSSLLSKNGTLYLSFIDGDPKNSDFLKGSTGDSMFFNYYLLDDVIQQLKKYNFNSPKIFRIDTDIKMSPQHDQIVLISQKD